MLDFAIVFSSQCDVVQAIHLRAATAQVVRAIQERMEQDPLGSPFFIQAGAGVSYPAIPLAHHIELKCRAEIDRLGLPQPPRDVAPEVRYQQCIQTAFPDAELRRAFWSRLIQDTEPSNATWLLAHLLGLHGLGHVGLTTNFDDHISRALIRLGRRAHVIDHPGTTLRMDPRRPDVQVVHLHGTYESYDCCNTWGEIKDRSQAMQEAVLRLLYVLSPLVFGYSGWKIDVFMKALRIRLREGGLPFNLRWFCYSEADARALPAWLVKHQSVQLVVPDTSNGRETLPAEEVLEAFARRLEIPVEPVAPSTLQSATADLPPETIALGRAEALLAADKHDEAVAVLGTVLVGSLREPLKDFFDSLLERLTVSTWQTAPNLTLEVARIRRRLAEDALGGMPGDLKWEIRRAKALHGEALGLRGLDRREEALALFGEIRETYASQVDTEMRARVARSLVAEGVTLFESKRESEAHKRWNEAIRLAMSGEEQSPILQDEEARARFNRALAWAKAGRREEALEGWISLMDSFVNVKRRAVRELVERAQDYLVQHERTAAAGAEPHVARFTYDIDFARYIDGHLEERLDANDRSFVWVNTKDVDMPVPSFEPEIGAEHLDEGIAEGIGTPLGAAPAGVHPDEEPAAADIAIPAAKVERIERWFELRHALDGDYKIGDIGLQNESAPARRAAAPSSDRFPAWTLGPRHGDRPAASRRKKPGVDKEIAAAA